MKLFFVLSQYSLDIFVNKIDIDNIIYNLTVIDNPTQISNQIQNCFQKISDKYLNNCDQIQLVIQNQASFTNTRTIALWCRSWSYFNSKKFLITKDLKVAEEILYSKEPRISKVS